MRRSFFILALLLGGCAEHLPLLYRPPLEQGNLLPAAKVAEIVPGMQRATVHYLLGAPLLPDPFQKGRELYLYRLGKVGLSQAQQQQVIIFYDAQDRVLRVEKSPQN